MKLDLNFPGFQEDLFGLEKKELNALIRTLRRCSKMDFQQVTRSSGLNVEKIKSMQTEQGHSVYSLRVSRSFRATFTVQGDFLRFIGLHPDHDSAYGKK
ncbi:MAG: hypothetical protein D3922_08185 [Candidatus Electrothrix sp. AR1]|nr:hypothetical protein [Candidatus Electrothrix sp. AR1]